MLGFFFFALLQDAGQSYEYDRILFLLRITFISHPVVDHTLYHNESALEQLTKLSVLFSSAILQLIVFQKN